MFTEKDIQAGALDPAAEQTINGFARLYSIIRILYGPGGCPWDREQTPKSMREHLIEECYEVLDAIDQGSSTHIQEELGDAALVITMIAHMYERNPNTPAISTAGVFSDICEKLIRRHPHVFQAQDPTADTLGSSLDPALNPALDSAGVLSQWEEIKQQEKAGSKPASALDNITGGLTPLERAVKLQKRAAKTGFDWPEITPVFDKVQEELKELCDAVVTGDSAAIEDEVGDVLFTVVNLARKLDTHPTPALNSANRKFESRFRRTEELLHQDGKHGTQLELDLLDSYWEKAKTNP